MAACSKEEEEEEEEDRDSKDSLEACSEEEDWDSLDLLSTAALGLGGREGPGVAKETEGEAGVRDWE